MCVCVHGCVQPSYAMACTNTDNKERGREDEREKMSTNEVKVRRKHSLITRRRRVYLHPDVIVRMCVCVGGCIHPMVEVRPLVGRWVVRSVGRSVIYIHNKQRYTHQSVRHVGVTICVCVHVCV